MSQSAGLKESYFGQIEDWLSEGKQLELLTASMLHRHVGGSYKQCVEALEAYLTNQPTPTDVPTPPASVKQVLSTAVDKVWGELWAIKQQELEVIKANFQRDKNRMQKLTDERLDLIDRFEQQVAEKDQEVSQLKQSVNERTEQCAERQRELEQIRAEFQQDRAMLQLLVDKRQEKIIELEQRLADTHLKLESLSQNIQEKDNQIRTDLEAAKQSHQTEVERKDAQIQMLTDALNRKEQTYADLADKYDQERTKHTEARTEQNAKIQTLELEVKSLSLQLVDGRNASQSVKVEQSVEIKHLEHMVSEHASRNVELEAKLDKLQDQLSAIQYEVSIKDDALKAEKVHRQWALELSNEQAREISQLSQKNEIRERELLRVTQLYERSEAQIKELREEINALIQYSRSH